MNLEKLTAYELLQEKELSDIASRGYTLRHRKSGARVVLVDNDDDNKVFYIGFRTTPTDETGVPHIIEHTVLCGSEKFPVKDPFIELAKGSLNTFLNAMTYPDKTVYPVASCNDQDFKNLMDVYMDAVLNPNITKYEEIFKQEGWHFELESVDQPIKINGVVYNEMKGAYSSPDEVLQSQIYKNLFPENTYSRDSGGNPVYIPELTYEQYLDFYHKYYHPSNSYIYIYGNVDFEERLQWLDSEYLGKYDYLQVDSAISLQKPFEEIKDAEATYSIASDDTEENKTYLSYNMVVGDSLDDLLSQTFDVLDYALVSAPGAPLKKALIDAGIGEDIYGSYDSGVMQPVFSIVAKNANASDRDRFVSIIRDVLSGLVADKVDRQALLAGINCLEFKYREADFGQFPKGLLFGLSCLDSWLFDDMKPFVHLESLASFAKLKELLDTDYYEEIIKKYLLDNKFAAIVTVKPEKNKNTAEEAALADKLQKYKESLSREELEEMVAQTAHLKKYQEEPSAEEDLKKLPMLGRGDMRREAMTFSNIEKQLGDIKVVRHDVESNGIDYLTLAFDVSDIREDEIGYMGFLSSVLKFIDTDRHSYGALSNDINIYTGGISFSASGYPDVRNPENFIYKYEIKIKVLEDNLPKALELADEIIRTSKFTDIRRLNEIVAQSKARLQMILSSSGHSVSAMRSMSGFSKYARYQDELGGIAYYRTVCGIEKLLKENPSAVTDKLAELCGRFFAQNRLIVSFTSNEKAYTKAVPVLEEYLGRLKAQSPVGPVADTGYNFKREAFTDASQIQYVARSGNFRQKGFAYTGALRVLNTILSYDYLWINVRVKGGAYGCMNSFLRTGDAYFVSYRDPNLGQTNQVYEGVPDYIRNFAPDERDMTKYIIGTFSSMDTPLNPEAKGLRAMTAYYEHIEYEDLQRERDEILNIRPEDINALAPLVEAVLANDNICVIGNENKIKEESELFEKIEKLYI